MLNIYCIDYVMEKMKTFEVCFLKEGTFVQKKYRSKNTKSLLKYLREKEGIDICDITFLDELQENPSEGPIPDLRYKLN